MKVTYYNQIIKLLKELNKSHPKFNMGKHLSTAVVGDLWGVSDRELLKALSNYSIELDSDVTHEDDVDEIIKQGMTLYDLYEEEEEF